MSRAIAAAVVFLAMTLFPLTLAGEPGPDAGVQPGHRAVTLAAGAAIPAAACTVDCAASAPTSATVGAQVPFSAVTATNDCSAGATVEWVFGDGTAAVTAHSTKHRYATAGTYTWTATAKAEGATCVQTGTVTVEPEPPCEISCRMHVPTVAPAGKSIQLLANCSGGYCVTGTVTEDWDFGDGSPHASTYEAHHTWASPGTYTWTYTRTKGTLSFTRSATITISATDPCELECAAMVGPAAGGSPSCGQPFRFSELASEDDCEGTMSYRWEFGDGSGSGLAEPLHSYLLPGTYDWALHVAVGSHRCAASGTVTVGTGTLLCAAAASPRAGPPPLQVGFSAAFPNATCHSPASVLWSLPGGATSHELAPSRTVDTLGLHRWWLGATADGQWCAETGPIVVAAPPPYPWAPQSAPTTASVNGLAAVSPTEAWAATGGSGLLHTPDGGVTWSAPTGSTFYAVEFHDASLGAAVGWCGFTRTTDGGATWRGFWYSECWGFTFTDVFPISGDVVWLSDTSGDLERWTYGQGGSYAGWSQKSHRVPGSQAVYSIFFTDADNGWAVGGAGSITRVTAASSASPVLTKVASPTSNNLLDIRMVNATTGWIVGAGGVILHTTDGATWTPQSSGTSLHLYALAVADASTAWAVGYGGVILATSDGGATWTAEVNHDGHSLWAAATFPGASGGTAGATVDRLALAGGTSGTVLRRLPRTCPEITVTPDALPAATGGASLDVTFAATGATGPYVFSLASGSLPKGVRLSSGGRLSGTPEEVGTFPITVRALDVSGCSGERPYTLEVGCGFGYCYANVRHSGEGLAVSYEASVSAVCDEPVTYLWQLGDGTTSNLKQLTHTFATHGSYAWSLTVTAGDATCVKSGNVVLKPCSVTCGAAPTSVTGKAPLEVHFFAHGSPDACGTATPTFSWDFGDGTTSTLEDPTHTYAGVGSFTWTVTVSVGAATCTQTGTVNVVRCLLSCSGGPGESRGLAPLTAELNASATCDGVSQPATFAWDLGDGSTWTGATGSHTWASPGSYRWSMTASAERQQCSRDGVVLLGQAPQASAWEQVDVPRGVSYDNWNDVDFASPTEGWLAGRDARLLHTHDHGVTWTAVATGAPPTAELRSVRFLDPDTGWVGGRCWVGRTADHGATWSRLELDCQNVELRRLVPATPTTAWGVGSAGWIWTLFRFTLGDDGAVASQSWLPGAGFFDLAFTDPEQALAVGYDGAIRRVTAPATGSPTFTTLSSGTTAKLNGIHMLDATTGWVVGDDGTILHTTDGGSTWTAQSSGTDLDLAAVRFADPDHGWAVGGQGLVLATDDGGASWRIELAPASFEALAVVDTAEAYAVSSSLYRRSPCTALALETTPLPEAEAGRTYQAGLRISGGVSPYRAWVVAGQLPPGLSVAVPRYSSSATFSGTPAAVGAFPFTLRVSDGRYCSSDHQLTLTVRVPATCTVVCDASAPASATAVEPVAFTGSAAAFTCSGAVAHDWDLGDGSPHVAVASPEHVYTAPGTYAWTYRATAGGVTCTRTGTIAVAAGTPHRYLVPSVAHLPGSGTTLWRTDVAAVNTSSRSAGLVLTYRSPAPTTVTATLAAGAAVEHVNVLESLFGLAATAKSSGSLEILASQPLAITSRTYNQTAAGTFGQVYPALTEADALLPGHLGVLPMLKRNNAFRTNLGIAALGASPATAEVKLLNASGAQVGRTVTITANPGEWAQQNDVFTAAGAGTQAVACATVAFTGTDGKAWAYASLVDFATGDPTTIPVQVVVTPAAATRYLIPSVAHRPGTGGTLWRTDLGVANRTGQAATLGLTYRSAEAPLTLSRTLAAGAAAEWGNLVESVLGLPAAADTAGSLEVASDVPLHLTSRTYNQTDTGTFGQTYPAVTAAEGLQAGQAAVLPMLKKNAAFRTNVGFVNVGEASVQVAFTLHDATGAQVGTTKVMTAAPGQWVQQSDIFVNVGAGTRNLAYATVEVLTQGGRAWVYASVVDMVSGDPTTIPALVP